MMVPMCEGHTKKTQLLLVNISKKTDQEVINVNSNKINMAKFDLILS